jgi:hypothetical protein
MNLDIPHPLLPLPSLESVHARVAKFGEAQARQDILFLKQERARIMNAERRDPFTRGYNSPIWNVIDQLLCDGNEVVLVNPNWNLQDRKFCRTIPDDFLREAARRKKSGAGPLTILGALEIWISGSNRSSKSEYAGKKIMRILMAAAERRTWCFADSEDVSIARQQPILWRYMPADIRARISGTGKLKEGISARINWNGTNFVGNKFKLPNESQNWFKNYKQNPADMEGDQLDALWCDELRDPELLRTLRVRMGDRGGIVLVTFTSIDQNYTAIVDEYDHGSKVVLESDAELLPIKGADGRPSGRFEKVPRVKLAGPGSDGNQRALIVYFHITDNPYYGFSWNPSTAEAGKRSIFGAERFYKLWRNATRSKILSRVYGILSRARLQQFPTFNTSWHEVTLERIPAHGTRYLIVDPCPGRNWFMLWILIDPAGRWFVYREWPSTGHNQPSAYVQGIGDPGPWATAGGTRGTIGGRVAFDGSPGPAQAPFGFGLDRYRDEIFRLEGREGFYIAKPEGEPRRMPVRRGLFGRRRALPARPGLAVQDEEKEAGERIYERWMDSRYASSPTLAKEAPTTNIIECEKVGLIFRAAPSEQNITSRSDGSIEKINTLLAYDDEVDQGEFSPRLQRLNEPRLFIADTCPNLRFALKEWTGRDGTHGACKDPVDCLRYAVLCELDYVDEMQMVWKGGGHY